MSSANACTFLASRTLHGLALDGHAPTAFLALNRFRTPYVAVVASSAWGIVALLGVNQDAMQVHPTVFHVPSSSHGEILGFRLAHVRCDDGCLGFMDHHLCHLPAFFLRSSCAGHISRSTPLQEPLSAFPCGKSAAPSLLNTLTVWPQSTLLWP